jgi:hypothetical protein
MHKRSLLQQVCWAVFGLAWLACGSQAKWQQHAVCTAQRSAKQETACVLFVMFMACLVEAGAWRF